jgi:ankyrin repeat protein
MDDARALEALPTRGDLRQAVMADDEERVAEILRFDPSLATADPAADLASSPVLTALYRARDDALVPLLGAKPRLTADEAAALGDVAALTAHLDARPELATTVADDGVTLLHRAAWFGRLDACTLLLDRGAGAGAVSRDEVEQTPLHMAAQRRHADVCELLIARGAPPDAQQAQGFTALHLAAYLGDEDLAILLLECGAHATVEADDGKTPADIAYLHNHDILATMLEVVAGGGSAA